MAKSVRESKKYQKLLALLNNNESATVTAWNALHPDTPVATEAEAEAEKAEAEKVKAEVKAEKKAARKAAAPVVPSTSEELAQVMVAKAGLIHIRGRIYSSIPVIEAQVRVLKTGKPELIQLAGQHRITAVVIFRMKDESVVAVQNLGEPS